MKLEISKVLPTLALAFLLILGGRPATATPLAETCAGVLITSDVQRLACENAGLLMSQELVIEAPPVTFAQGIGVLLAGGPDAVLIRSYFFAIGDPNPNLLPLPINEDANGNGRLDDDPMDPLYEPGPDGQPEVDLDGSGELSRGGLGGFILPYVQLQSASTDYGSINDADQRHNPGGCLDPNIEGPDGGRQCGHVGRGLIQTFAISPFFGGQGQGLGATLSPEQEALLGCGPVWGTQCDDTGIDLANADGRVLFQSWPGEAGTELEGDELWTTNRRNEEGTAFADQPGLRAWYFDTLARGVGYECRDGQAGCRHKWLEEPTFPELAEGPIDGDDDDVVDPDPRLNVESMNFSGDDWTCADEIVSNSVSMECQYLSDWMVAIDDFAIKPGIDEPENEGPDPANAPTHDRSWSYVEDGDPDSLGMAVLAPVLSGLNGLGGLNTYRVKTPTDVPDFYYRRPSFTGLDPYAATNRDCPGDPAYGGFPEDQVIAAGGSQFVPCGKGGHPLTGQPFANELAALSWNLLVLTVDQNLSGPGGRLFRVRNANLRCADNTIPDVPEGCLTDYEVARMVYLDPDDCSLVSPLLCPEPSMVMLQLAGMTMLVVLKRKRSLVSR